ncbi:hypothetical protein BT93_L0806 [Corymbia citriodora subsp. variegata]|uniref:SHSP domain-containing protein n=1 Tax=Corymbia citriodora subsp. variegata TaxID=360336 RepID=A0A8T0CRP7_CORYI|nr:hypothetical protein BT93_L0806 [Corymbia citriodora subsp. variegata]KAF7849423.1 hypothetical protein BT93_L0806 [Corymbia citriodora subsp. variegata]
MAARSGAGRPATSSSSRPREMTGRPSYENIEPKSVDWREEKEAHILNVHLPGFLKEQIRVTYDENSRTFNVQGDCPLENNRIGRLNVDFAFPDNCKMKEMQGKFQDEMLTITIPKDYISPFFIPKETSTKGLPTGKPLDLKAAERPGEKIPGKGKETSDVLSTSWEKEMKRANDTYLAGFDGKEVRQPKKSDLAKSKAGESKSGADDARKTMRDGKMVEAEKQLLVNVGVAALVLVALGAYVGYNYASF